ncbi:MAG TPA: type I DNA topoisomerase [Firmicutes bacterium]|jgi:DNA topoisomerase-1|nr:type I DNA topoisomerase [Candidatus Fermentithermobacillaceae bacterium]
MAAETKRPLIIVESPTKAKTISRFMKSRYRVMASLGHVRDLPKSTLGVDVHNNFAPKYINIRGKGDLIRELREASKKASSIYLATDPDREGEAISWHLCTILGIDPGEAKRVTFHEITEKAVKEAFSKPKPVNQRLVDAQQARRVLDRLVGYSLSPLLWHKIRPGLSAGRVQSAALRLIVARDSEIASFKPEEYWTLDAYLEGEEGQVKARYFGEKGRKKALSSRSDVDAVLSSIKGKPFIVASVKPRERKRQAPAPFTTSTLQQEASRKLGFPVRKTMSVAQTLYEGVELGKDGYTGLITYMRTDSVRVAASAASEARQYIGEVFGSQYAGGGRSARPRPQEQGAHEAIRPTSVLRLPSEVKGFLKNDQYRLYKLIWDRFVASQMAPAVYDTVTADIKSGDATFRATGSRMKFAGFTKVYEEGRDSPAEDDKEIIPLREGEVLSLVKTEPLQHFTEPPPRYTEATLVKALEENGIGRPSTYAPIIATLFEREYVAREQRRLFATELGITVDKLLTENFPSIVDLAFTAGMEKKLDSVEEGEVDWVAILREFWQPLKEQIDRAEEEIARVKVADEPAGEDCEKCGRPMVIKRGRYGKFIACSGYPECKNTKPILEKTGVTCPKCGKGDIVARRTRKGRVFYGCSQYPNCDYTTWNRPVAGSKCPACGSFLVEVQGRRRGFRCSNQACDHRSQKVDN